MMIVARDRDYPELLEALRGRKVGIWACNTCARLCNGVGGRDSADALAAKLAEDGVEVVSVGHTSASCIDSKVEAGRDAMLAGGPDVIVALTCSIGARRAESSFGVKCLNPVETLGCGYFPKDGGPVLTDGGRDVPVSDITDRCSPFVLFY